MRAKFTHNFLCAAAVCLAAAGAAVARFPASGESGQQPQQQPQEQSTIRVNVNLVLLEATVRTKSGEVINDLKKDDFVVREDGKQQKVQQFSRDQIPLAMALVVDLSDSIQPFLGQLRDASYVALQTLKPDDEVALYAFSTTPQLLVPLTKNKRSVAEKFDTLEIGGSTNINGAIFEAAQYLLQTAPNGRRVIVLISDNVPTDTGYVRPHDSIFESLAADAAVYSLKIPGDNPVSTRFLAAQIPGLIDVKKLCEQTGGEVFDVEKAGGVPTAFSELIERIKTRYTLGYYSSANPAEGRLHKLDVTLENSHGKKGKDYTILSKSGFYFTPHSDQ